MAQFLFFTTLVAMEKVGSWSILVSFSPKSLIAVGQSKRMDSTEPVNAFLKESLVEER